MVEEMTKKIEVLEVVFIAEETGKYPGLGVYNGPDFVVFLILVDGDGVLVEQMGVEEVPGGQHEVAHAAVSEAVDGAVVQPQTGLVQELVGAV